VLSAWIRYVDASTPALPLAEPRRQNPAQSTRLQPASQPRSLRVMLLPHLETLRPANVRESLALEKIKHFSLLGRAHLFPSSVAQHWKI